MKDRRRFLEGIVGAGGLFLLGCEHQPPGGTDPFAGGRFMGTLPFIGEGEPELETPIGQGLDGRLYTDLTKLGPDDLVTPNERFYVRTRYPDLLDPRAPFQLLVHGLVEAPLTLGRLDLEVLGEPQGTHVMECSGNTAGAAFGLLSAAQWTGVPLTRVLKLMRPLPSASRVLVSGFDGHGQPSERSTPGAAWVFSFPQLEQTGAFLATQMNGVPLPADHGAPVRLMVPGWYGCTCIKWVNELRLVDEDEPATSQMIEFASRTMQPGTPALARDYLPASMDQAAMPVRIERWRVGDRWVHKVVGILWGGDRPTQALAIRFNPSEPFVPVALDLAPSTNESWSLFTHAWTPTAKGTYRIELKVTDPSIRTRRLDRGYYARTVEVRSI